VPYIWGTMRLSITLSQGLGDFEPFASRLRGLCFSHPGTCRFSTPVKLRILSIQKTMRPIQALSCRVSALSAT
jgi:hypothetical protein